MKFCNHFVKITWLKKLKSQTKYNKNTYIFSNAESKCKQDIIDLYNFFLAYGKEHKKKTTNKPRYYVYQISIELKNTKNQ